MDCDTTGIEPDFALVKFKKLAGGGYFKIINRAVPEALRALGYKEHEIAEIEVYAVGHGSLRQAPAINHATLTAKGFTDEVLGKLEMALATAFDIKFAFNKWTLGEDFLKSKLGVTDDRARRSGVRSPHPPRLLEEGRRGGEPPLLRRDDAGRRARTSRPSIYRCSIAPIRAAVSASASCRSTATSR